MAKSGPSVLRLPVDQGAGLGCRLDGAPAADRHPNRRGPAQWGSPRTSFQKWCTRVKFSVLRPANQLKINKFRNAPAACSPPLLERRGIEMHPTAPKVPKKSRTMFWRRSRRQRLPPRLPRSVPLRPRGAARGDSRGPAGNASWGMLAAPVPRSRRADPWPGPERPPHQSESIAICDPSALCRGRTTIKRQFPPRNRWPWWVGPLAHP
jgi:hypothetical protein